MLSKQTQFIIHHRLVVGPVRFNRLFTVSRESNMNSSRFESEYRVATECDFATLWLVEQYPNWTWVWSGYQELNKGYSSRSNQLLA